MAAKRARPTFEFEKSHLSKNRQTVGVDEVGRGCLAGPVVTAAVVLPVFEQPWWSELDDSKRLTPATRERLAEIIWREAEVQVAWCLPDEIDRWNILHASMIAMRRALWPFAGRAQAVLVDGHLSPFDPRFKCLPGEASRLGFTHVETLVKGDQRSLSIAAASIVAKVYRDQWMVELEQYYPGYGFAGHKGYSTPAHYEGLAKLGPCAIHRKSFEPIRSGLCNGRRDGKKSIPATTESIDV